MWIIFQIQPDFMDLFPNSSKISRFLGVIWGNIFICKGTHYSPFFRIFAAIFRIVYDERQNYIGIVEHIHDALVKYIAS